MFEQELDKEVKVGLEEIPLPTTNFSSILYPASEKMLIPHPANPS